MKRPETFPFLRKEIVGPQIRSVAGYLVFLTLFTWFFSAGVYGYLQRGNGLSFTQIIFLGPIQLWWAAGQQVGLIAPTAEPTLWAITWRLLLIGMGGSLWLNQPVTNTTYLYEQQEAHRREQGRRLETELPQYLSIEDDQMVLAHAYVPHRVPIGLSWQTPGHVLCVGDYTQRQNQLATMLMGWPGTAVIFDPWGKLYESANLGFYWSNYIVPDTALGLPVTPAEEKMIHWLLLWRHLQVTEAEMHLAKLLAQIIWQYSEQKKSHPFVVWGDMAVGDPVLVWQTLAAFRPDVMPRLLGTFPPEQWWHSPVAKVYQKICQLWKTYRPYLPLFCTSRLPDDWLSQNNRLFITFSPDEYRDMGALLHSWLHVFCQAQRAKQRILFIIPYLAELGIPELPYLLTTITHFGGRCVAGIDSLDQLEGVYGPQGAQTILNSFAHTVWSTPKTEKTARYMSQRYGTKLTLNWLTPNPLPTTSYANPDPKPLGWALFKETAMSPEAMLALPKDELLLEVQDVNRYISLAHQPDFAPYGKGHSLLPTSSFNPHRQPPLTVKWGVATTTKKQAARTTAKLLTPSAPAKPTTSSPVPSPPTGAQLALPLGQAPNPAKEPQALPIPSEPPPEATQSGQNAAKKITVEDLF